jgi:tetratricopeptide (TPR) repeat protein
MSKGYVYILVTPSENGDLLKIGKSDKRPETSAYQGGKGVPYVAYNIVVSDFDRAERVIRNRFKEYRQGYDDLFNIPIRSAISYIKMVVQEFDKIAHVNKAIEMDPENASFYNNLGCIYDKLEDHDDSIPAYQKAIELAPKNAVFHNNLGCCYGKIGLYHKAIESFNAAVEIQPDFIKNYFDLGFSYHQIGLHKQAVDVFEKAIRLNPDIAQLHYNLGHSYSKMNQDIKAVKAFESAIRINPKYVSAHYSLGVKCLDLGALKAGLKQYNILKKLDGNKARQLFAIIYKHHRKKMTPHPAEG